MNSNPRRMFLRTAGATLVVPFVDTTFTGAQGGQRTDPVLRELARQAKAVAQKIAKPDALPTGEAARNTASLLRVLAAQSAAIGFDARIGKAVRSAVAARGRQSVLNRRPDLAAAAAELGITADVSRVGASPDDPAARSAALDAILKNGVTSAWLVAAQELEKIGAKIDAQRGVQLIRQSPSDCTSGQWGLFMLEVSMIMACSYGLAAGPEVCAIATAAYIAYRLSLLIMGCG